MARRAAGTSSALSRLMKKLIIALSLVLGTSSAFADFKVVKEKFCGDRKIELLAGERIFIDPVKNIVGVGSTIDGCKVVDFKAIVPTTRSFNYMKADAAPVMRRSSCRPEDRMDYAGPAFTAVEVTDSSLTLLGMGGSCDSIKYTF